jgi:hypothetical protein
MEPKNDPELSNLLREWEAPALPASLDVAPRQCWWRAAVFGYIRVPVPVACALAILILFGGWRLARPSPGQCTAPAAAANPCLMKSVC